MSGRNLRDSTKKHICRTLQSELGDSVQIFPDDKGRLLMVSNDLSLQGVVLENQSLHKSKMIDFNKIIDQTSSHIRSAIKNNIASSPWPYHPSDVSSSDAIQGICGEGQLHGL